MGIRGLLKFIRPACRQTTIKEFENQTIAVDTSCLLYKAFHVGCPLNIYIAKVVKLLKQQNCNVILVFDGKPVPEKYETLKRRHATSENKKISKDDVERVMNAFRISTQVIQAPYEADAQLAFLVNNGLAQLVLTEDSDLIVYGCEKIIYKFNLKGECLLYEKAKIPIDIDFATFRKMCIVAGCDYLPGGIKGLGLKKTYKILKKDSFCETDLFNESILHIEKIFLHQQVYDPIQKVCRSLS